MALCRNKAQQRCNVQSSHCGSTSCYDLVTPGNTRCEGTWHKGLIGRAGCGVRTSRLGRKKLKPSMRSRWLLKSSLRRWMTPAVSILHTCARNSLRFGPRFGRNPRIRSNACLQACNAPPIPAILQGCKRRAIHVLVGKAVLDLFDVRERCTNTACRACVEASTTQRHQPT